MLRTTFSPQALFGFGVLKLRCVLVRKVPNVRIERLWQETNRVVIAFYKDIFHYLKDLG